MTPDLPSQHRIPWKRFLIPVGVSIVTLIGLGISIDGDTPSHILRQVDPSLLLLASMKVPVLVLLWSLRWYIILRSRQIPVRFHQTIVGALIRSFFNNLTPGVGTGGEPAGAYYLAKRVPMTFTEAIASTAAERMVQGLVFVVIVLGVLGVCLPMMSVSSTLVRSIVIGLVGFMGFVGLMLYLSLFRFHYARRLIETIIRTTARLIPPLRSRLDANQIGESLDNFHREYRAFLRSSKAILGICLLTAIHWGVEILQPYLLFRALHVEVPFWLIMTSTTIIRVMGIFSLIPGGAGLVEGMNFGLYAGLSSVSNQVILTETVLFRALDSWIPWIVSGIVTSVVSASFTGHHALQAFTTPPLTFLRRHAANLITGGRILLLFLATLFAVSGNFVLMVLAIPLTLVAIMMDWLDGVAARRYGCASKIGGILDIVGDRIVENVWWIIFAWLRLIPLWVPIVVVSRGFITDAIRNYTLSKGRTAFMMQSRIGHYLVASRLSRGSYCASKVVAFVGLCTLNAVQQVFPPAEFIVITLKAVALVATYITVALCVIRGIPVVTEFLQEASRDKS